MIFVCFRKLDESRMPASVENYHAEYAAAQSACALFDQPGRTQIELTGSDRARFLHNFCTNDIRSLQPGHGCEAFVTNVQGKVLAHIFVYAEPESLWLDSVPGCADRVLAHLQKYQISERVDFHDRTAETALLFLTGPDASTTLHAAGALGADLPPLQHVRTTCAGQAIHVRRNDLLALPGFQIVCPVAGASDVRDRLLAAGARLASAPVFDALRIEAGFPEYGRDITDANLAQEVDRTESAISFSKGCYLGQEPIARIDALGHVNQQLRGLRLASGLIPAVGSDVVSTDDEARPLGKITSAALSFGSDFPVALAYMKRHFDSPGLQVRVRCGEELVPAEIFWPGKRES